MLVYDGVDPQGGLQYSRYDRTRVEKVFKETLKKEKDLTDKYPKVTSFQMNLANGQTRGNLQFLKHSHNPNMIITEKVEKRTPLERNTEPPFRSAADEYGNQMIRHVEKPTWQKIDLPQSRGQEIGWLIAASMTSDKLNAQRNHSTRNSAVGHARVEAHRNASLNDLSRGKMSRDGLKVDPDAEKSSGSKGSKDKMTRSAPQLPRLIPHLPDDGPRPEVAMLNNQRFKRPKNKCPETIYADIYYAIMRSSPFNQAAARG